MDSKKLINYKEGPEAKIQREIIAFLTLRGWFVKETHGSAYQYGFPDLFCTHTKYGQRWVEVKNLAHYVFTPAQIENFPKFVAFGSGIWILVAANDAEYAKLFKPCNWMFYLDVMK
jgi:hypothetical protein